jgi:hypothetical protein
MWVIAAIASRLETSTTLAGAIAVREGDQAAAGGERRGDDVGLMAGEAHRRVLGRADRDHRAAEGTRDEVIRAIAALWPGLTEAGDRSQDEIRPRRCERCVVETALGQIADREALDHEIDGLDELPKTLAIAFAIEIEEHTPLVGVRIGEAEPRGLTLVRSVGRHGRCAMTRAFTARRLELDDVRAEIGEQLPAVGRALGREVEDSKISERAPAHVVRLARHRALRHFQVSPSHPSKSPTPMIFHLPFPLRSPSLRPGPAITPPKPG